MEQQKDEMTQEKLSEVILSGVFLCHFIEYALLKGSGGTPPEWGQG